MYQCEIQIFGYFRLETEDIPADVLASGGAAGFTVPGFDIVKVADDPDKVRQREEAERRQKREIYASSQSDR